MESRRKTPESGVLPYATGFTFADVYFKDVSAPLVPICYLGPHAWYIKENEIKQARQKSKKKMSKERRVERPINTVMRMSSAFS